MKKYTRNTMEAHKVKMAHTSCYESTSSPRRLYRTSRYALMKWHKKLQGLDPLRPYCTDVTNATEQLKRHDLSIAIIHDRQGCLLKTELQEALHGRFMCWSTMQTFPGNNNRVPQFVLNFNMESGRFKATQESGLTRHQ